MYSGEDTSALFKGGNDIEHTDVGSTEERGGYKSHSLLLTHPIIPQTLSWAFGSLLVQVRIYGTPTNKGKVGGEI